MITLSINGRSHSLDVEPETPLLWAIRDEAGLTGTKFGCGAGLCGACTVHVDGVATRSCSIAVKDVAGKPITTIEGLAGGGEHPVQTAWIEAQVPQCGYCQSGQIMQAAAFLREKPKPTETEIRDAMAQNICRCMSYVRINKAVARAAELMAKK